MIRAGRLEGRIANLKPERMLYTRVLLKRSGGEKAPDLYGPVSPDGRYQVSSIPPGTYDAVLKELVPDPALDLTKAGTAFSYSDLKERLTPLGTVEIRAGETAMLDGRAP
jgi:hypothetical protein